MKSGTFVAFGRLFVVLLVLGLLILSSGPCPATATRDVLKGRLAARKNALRAVEAIEKSEIRRRHVIAANDAAGGVAIEGAGGAGGAGAVVAAGTQGLKTVTLPRILCQGKLRCNVEFPSVMPHRNNDPKYFEPIYNDANTIAHLDVKKLISQVELQSKVDAPQVLSPPVLRTHVIRRKVKWKALDEDESEAEYGPEEEDVVVVDSDVPQQSLVQASVSSSSSTDRSLLSVSETSSLPSSVSDTSLPSSLSSLVQVEVRLPEDEQQQIVAESQVKGCEVNRTQRCSDGLPLRKIPLPIAIEVGCGPSMPDHNLVNEIIGDVLSAKFGPCCTLHNVCYATIGISKDDCDFTFYKCMLRTCSGWLCKAKAFGYYQAVSDGGCSSFDNAQKFHGC